MSPEVDIVIIRRNAADLDAEKQQTTEAIQDMPLSDAFFILDEVVTRIEAPETPNNEREILKRAHAWLFEQLQKVHEVDLDEVACDPEYSEA